MNRPSATPRPLFQFANLSSFAEKMLCPERSLVKIRDDMPLDRAQRGAQLLLVRRTLASGASCEQDQE